MPSGRVIEEREKGFAVDIFRFFNSKDVADHLRKIGYEFSMPEAAFVVYRSRDATLDEKVATWLEIVETMPDCSMEGRLNMDPIPSFRAFLHDYIDLQRRSLTRFLESEGCMFGFSYYFADGDWEQDKSLFSDSQSCLEYIGTFCEGMRWYREEAPFRFKIEKRPVDQWCSGPPPAVLLNRSRDIFSVERVCLGRRIQTSPSSSTGCGFPFPRRSGEVISCAKPVVVRGFTSSTSFLFGEKRSSLTTGSPSLIGPSLMQSRP